MAQNVLHINGEVRDVRVLTNKDTGAAYASIITVLSEPKGGTVDVMAWDRVLSPADARALDGATIDATVEVGQSVRNSRTFLEIGLVSIDSAEAA